MDYEELGRRVRAVRQAKQLTIKQMAEKVGISASFLGHIERGTRTLSVDTLVMLCNALEISPLLLLRPSLDFLHENNPDQLSDDERRKVRRFLHLAEGTIRGFEE